MVCVNCRAVTANRQNQRCRWPLTHLVLCCGPEIKRWATTAVLHWYDFIGCYLYKKVPYLHSSLIKYPENCNNQNGKLDQLKHFEQTLFNQIKHFCECVGQQKYLCALINNYYT